MAIPQASLTVFFEAPFWVGLYERWEAGHYRVCRIVFGAEPKDYEVLDYLLRNFHRLSFSPALPGGAGPAQAGNPKRRQREIQRSLQKPVKSTKAQQALSLQRETGKERRRQSGRAAKEAEAERQFALRQQRRRAKHRGHGTPVAGSPAA